MKDIRNKFNNQMEEWKENEKNIKAKCIGNKNIIHQEIISKSKNIKNELKSIKNEIELKNECLKELRIKSDMCIPEWKEDLLDEQIKIKGNRNMMICEIRENKEKFNN